MALWVPGGFKRFGHLSLLTRFQKSKIGWPQQPLTEKELKFRAILKETFQCETPCTYAIYFCFVYKIQGSILLCIREMSLTFREKLSKHPTVPTPYNSLHSMQVFIHAQKVSERKNLLHAVKENK